MEKPSAKRITTTVIVCTFLFLLFFIPLSLFFVSRTQPMRTTTIPLPTNTLPPPTIVPTTVPTLALHVTQIPIQIQDPQTRLLELIQNRQPLSADDLAAKNKMKLFLPKGHNSGIVYRATDFTIDYVQDPDLFQAEVLIPDVAKAKTEATYWFFSEGMSQQGVCNLPVEFYLNSSVKAQLPDNYTFNPLPDGC